MEVRKPSKNHAIKIGILSKDDFDLPQFIIDLANIQEYDAIVESTFGDANVQIYSKKQDAIRMPVVFIVADTSSPTCFIDIRDEMSNINKQAIYPPEIFVVGVNTANKPRAYPESEWREAMDKFGIDNYLECTLGDNQSIRQLRNHIEMAVTKESRHWYELGEHYRNIYAKAHEDENERYLIKAIICYQKAYEITPDIVNKMNFLRLLGEANNSQSLPDEFSSVDEAQLKIILEGELKNFDNKYGKYIEQMLTEIESDQKANQNELLLAGVKLLEEYQSSIQAKVQDTFNFFKKAVGYNIDDPINEILTDVKGKKITTIQQLISRLNDIPSPNKKLEECINSVSSLLQFNPHIELDQKPKSGGRM